MLPRLMDHANAIKSSNDTNARRRRRLRSPVTARVCAVRETCVTQRDEHARKRARPNHGRFVSLLMVLVPRSARAPE